MLIINQEFRKGILFVRLLGVLNIDTVNYLKKEITSLVKDMKISNVVFNIKELDAIDISGVNEILLNYELCKKNKGISLLCGVNENIQEYINRSPINCMSKISDEISAINMINI